MIRARFHLLCARLPGRHARVGLCRVGARVRVECLRVGRFFARSQGVRLRIRHARVGLCRVGLRLGRFSIRSQCVRLRIR